MQDACRPTYVGIRVQPCAMVCATQSALRLGCEQPRLAPPMYMLEALYGDALYQVAIVVSGCAVQASKPRPVNRVSDGERVLLGVRLPSEVARSLLAKVRASAWPDGVVISAVASSKRTDEAISRAPAVSLPAATTTPTGLSVGGDHPVGADDALEAAGREVHGFGATDQVRRAGAAARVAEVDRVPVEPDAAGLTGEPVHRPGLGHGHRDAAEGHRPGVRAAAALGCLRRRRPERRGQRHRRGRREHPEEPSPVGRRHPLPPCSVVPGRAAGARAAYG